MKKFLWLLIAVVAVGLIAGGVFAYSWFSSPEAPTLEISDAWARATAGSDGGEESVTSAIYLTIHNSGRTADKLLTAATDAAKVVQLHDTDTRNDVSMMFLVESVDIPARRDAKFEPGGMHIMLLQLNQSLRPGDTITVTLDFEKSGQRTVIAEVRAP